MPDTTALCRLGGTLAFSVDNAITLAVIGRHGHELAEEIQFRVLRSHQEHLFLDGLAKLGLDATIGDPVRCARFHVLSNHLGGLRVRYAEDGERAWVVYDTPYWIDSPWTPGMGVAAIRPELLIRTMAAWHANNGVLLGNPRLAFVMTELVARGGCCDAGYFIEADHDLAPDERLQLRLDEGLPPGLDLRAPELDPVAWPLERQAKAWRNFSVAYVGGRTAWLVTLAGVEEAARIVGDAVRLVLLQRRELIAETLAIAGPPSPAQAAALWGGWHASWGDEVAVAPTDGGGAVGTVHRSRLHEVGEFRPPAAPLPRAIEAAIGSAWSVVVPYAMPGVAVAAEGSMDDPGDPWRFTFRGRP